MTSSVKNIRKTKFVEQKGQCHYCCQPMWEKNRKLFAFTHGISKPASNWLRSTAEHLVARQDGGADVSQNIVAACRYCNRTRHTSPKPMPPADYAQKVRKRLWKGKWHGIMIIPVHSH